MARFDQFPMEAHHQVPRHPKQGERWKTAGDYCTIVFFDEPSQSVFVRFDNEVRQTKRAPRNYGIDNWSTWTPPAKAIPPTFPAFFVANRSGNIIRRASILRRVSTALPTDEFIVIYVKEKKAEWKTRAEIIDMIADDEDDPGVDDF